MFPVRFASSKSASSSRAIATGTAGSEDPGLMPCSNRFLSCDCANCSGFMRLSALFSALRRLALPMRVPRPPHPQHIRWRTLWETHDTVAFAAPYSVYEACFQSWMYRTPETDVGLPLDFVSRIKFPPVKLDQGKLQETAHRLFLVDEKARQVLRKVIMFVGTRGFDAVERDKDLLLKPN